MNIKEFIAECKKIAKKYGDDCEIRGWGDEGGSIGIEALKKVGTCKTTDWFANIDADDASIAL